MGSNSLKHFVITNRFQPVFGQASVDQRFVRFADRDVDATFALLHPGLSPTADANGNGIPNFGDYAAGGNPSAPDDPTLRPQLAGNQLTFSFRNNAADLTREFQKSTTLLSGSWQQLIENTDYTVTTTVSSGGRSLQTLTLTNALRSSNSKLFFSQEFQPTP